MNIGNWAILVPIALLYVPLKLVERLLFNRVSPEVYKLIPPEQAGFRKGRSCADQVLSLTSSLALNGN